MSKEVILRRILSGWWTSNSETLCDCCLKYMVSDVKWLIVYLKLVKMWTSVLNFHTLLTKLVIYCVFVLWTMFHVLLGYSKILIKQIIMLKKLKQRIVTLILILWQKNKTTRYSLSSSLFINSKASGKYRFLYKTVTGTDIIHSQTGIVLAVYYLKVAVLLLLRYPRCVDIL